MTTITVSDLPLLLALVRSELAINEDNLFRCQRAFKDYEPEQMTKEHGHSGLSRAELLSGYRKDRDRAQQLLKELEAGL